MNILITGGAGYIGSHACILLLESGHHIIVIDNLCNSKAESLDRVQMIAGKKIKFYQGDLRDQAFVDDVFNKNRIDAVIHFAGLKSVAESVTHALMYYQNNLVGTMVLCDVMQQHGVKKIVFSSSATVYGTPSSNPVAEDAPTRPASPYGRTKMMIENILKDIYSADKSWDIALLRYFNPVGAHGSGRIGEDPAEIPNNLMPYICKVAVGDLEEVNVYGDDYPTPDGTGVRDYIHVMDLVDGHLKALEKVVSRCGVATYNLGTGRGYSVLEMISAFEAACGKKIPRRIVDRRPGDVPVYYADPLLAEKELGWRARRGIDQMCLDAWRWQSMNPKGYA